MVFYLMNGKTNLFYKKSGGTTWGNIQIKDEIYGVKLSSSGNSNYEYNLTYVIKKGGTIKLQGALYTIKDAGVYRNDCCGTVTTLTAGTITRGCFENDYDHFYFLTYSDTSDFSCGYYD